MTITERVKPPMSARAKDAYDSLPSSFHGIPEEQAWDYRLHNGPYKRREETSRSKAVMKELLSEQIAQYGYCLLQTRLQWPE